MEICRACGAKNRCQDVCDGNNVQKTSGRKNWKFVLVVLCIFVGYRQNFIGLPEVRVRVRAGKRTAEDLARFKKHKMVGLVIIAIGIGFGLPDLMRFLCPSPNCHMFVAGLLPK
jgi:hypothetical protein